MDMPDMNEDRLGDFAKKKVAESDARVKKMNPKGRKLDKKGNPIVTKEELAKSGMSLRDFLNKERGLTRRKDSKPDIEAPMQGPAVKANPMAKKTAPEAADAPKPSAGPAIYEKKRAAPPSAGPAVYEKEKASKTDMYKSKMKDIIKEKAAQEREEQYGSGLKKGGKVKGYASGGSVARGGGAATRGTKFKGVC